LTWGADTRYGPNRNYRKTGGRDVAFSGVHASIRAEALTGEIFEREGRTNGLLSSGNTIELFGRLGWGETKTESCQNEKAKQLRLLPVIDKTNTYYLQERGIGGWAFKKEEGDWRQGCVGTAYKVRGLKERERNSVYFSSKRPNASQTLDHISSQGGCTILLFLNLP